MDGARGAAFAAPLVFYPVIYPQHAVFPALLHRRSQHLVRERRISGGKYLGPAFLQPYLHAFHALYRLQSRLDSIGTAGTAHTLNVNGLVIQPFDLEDGGPGAVVAASDHHTLVVGPVPHDAAALKGGIDVAADAVPSLRALAAVARPPEGVLIAVALKEKGIPHIVSSAHLKIGKYRFSSSGFAAGVHACVPTMKFGTS